MLLDKVLNNMGKNIDQLCTDLHSLFKYSAVRRENFEEIQVELELPEHNFQQHTEVHWLSLGPAIKRILEQWDAIVHFVVEMAKDSARSPKGAHYKRSVHDVRNQRERCNQELLLNL